MKKAVLTVSCVMLIAGAGYLFKTPLWDGARHMITQDMFVGSDTDPFDPGLEIGQTFPAIKTLYRGKPRVDIGDFIGDKGLVFIANRSANW